MIEDRCSTPNIFDEPTDEIARHVSELVVLTGPTWRGTVKDDEILRDLRRHAEELARRVTAHTAWPWEMIPREKSAPEGTP